MGLRRVAAGAVRDDDEEGLHRRTDLLLTADPGRRPDHRRDPGDLLAERSAPAIIWLFFGLLLGYLSAIRAGGWLDRFLTGVSIAGISIPVFLLAPVLLYFLTYKIEIFPNAEYVALTEDPCEWARPPDPALVHAGDPLDRLLQPRPALEHARRDERGLRPHRPRQGAERAPGDDPPRAAQLADPDHHPLRARLRRDHRRHRDHHRSPLSASTASASTRPKRSNKFELPPIMGVTLYGAFFVVFVNALVDIAYAYLDPRVRLGSARRNERARRCSPSRDLRVGFATEGGAGAGGRRGQLRPAPRARCWRSSASRARARASPRRRSSA